MDNFTGAPPQLPILVVLLVVVAFLYVRHVKVNTAKLNAFVRASPEEQDAYDVEEVRRLQQFAMSRVGRRTSATAAQYRESARVLGEWLGHS
ncbi:hypothetical protein ACFUOZ_19610 [Paenarthrobacter sp. NPDC057355]|uniref:hypothetical protein n=1 Tax=Paenarthrobacter sp. NPDC057355 TaxID=3346105 RepID=UPI00364126C2